MSDSLDALVDAIAAVDWIRPDAIADLLEKIRYYAESEYQRGLTGNHDEAPDAQSPTFLLADLSAETIRIIEGA